MNDTHVFPVQRATTRLTFTCPGCGKANRKRTFAVEHTINPFNKNADGSVKPLSQVLSDAKAEAVRERDQFASLPLCKACEDALTWPERMALHERRRQASVCLACDLVLRDGDEVLWDVSGDPIHAACCGPERASYVRDTKTGEPLRPDDPIPKPFKWSTQPAGRLALQQRTAQ